MKKIVVLIATFFTFLSGLVLLIHPKTWLKSKINPFSNEVIKWDFKTSFFYKVDILFQNLFGRKLQFARNIWVRGLEEAYKTDLKTGEVKPLPEFDWKQGSLEEFEKKFRLKQHPVVLRGFLNQSERFNKWDIESFVNKFGNEEVTLTCPVQDGYKGKVKEINIPGVYLHNSEILLKKNPSLFLEMGFDLLPKTIAKNLMFSGVAQLFAGRKKTGTWWHCAGGINLFLMLEGQKKWSFIDPENSPRLFPKSVGKGHSAYYVAEGATSSKVYQNNFEKLSEEDQRLLTKTQGNFVSNKMKEIFNSVDRYEVVLNPGDVLLIPAWWWHDVENITETTMAAATRWFDPSRPKLANSIFDIGTRLNPSFFFTAANAALTQKLVNKDKSLNASGQHDLEEHLTMLTRAVDMKNYGDLSEKVEEYYLRTGHTREEYDQPQNQL